MPESISNLEDNRVQLSVAGKIDLEGLTGLFEALRGALAGSAPVVLSIGSGDPGIPLLQLLCAAHRTAVAAKRTLAVEWQQPGEACKFLHESGFLRHVPCSCSTDGECLWREDRWT
ncbi:STAS domain-containing protein [Desulfuromonas sp. DDH964]|uniref:STAS domain-containing protein n=1 Tax=Desulfuromonas sp. DDH964 TaxID=1823759 RepID=UPI0012FA2F40|nr:STAS domain-containing protein [Desulfuromonas sp. DDH964]